MFRKLFLNHPAAVGETYFEHQAAALKIAGPLYKAALAVTVHALVPGLCQKTGSQTILRLHQRITGGRGRGAAMEGEYTI